MRYGFYRQCITPPEGTGLAGYGREPTSKGIYDDLYMQILLLEDDQHRRLLLMAFDLIGVDSWFAERMRRWINKQHRGLTPERVIFSCTHTHCGPATAAIIPSVGTMSPAYMSFFEKSLRQGIMSVLKTPLKTGTLYAGMGHCRLGVNRRLRVEYNNDGKIEVGYEMRPNLKGTTDPQLGVLQIRGKDEEIVLINYSCHPTTRGGYKVSGDYPAAAARTLRADHFGRREVMFLQGGGADIKVPSMTEDKSRFAPGDSDKVVEYGEILADAVRKVLKKGMRRLAFCSHATRIPFSLPYDTSRMTIQNPRDDTPEFNRFMRWRRKMDKCPEGVPMEWTVWQLSKECRLMALPGEICHGIGVSAKRQSKVKFPFFLGYSNGCPCYIPTDKILKEGGYEGLHSMVPFGHAHPFKPGIDIAISAHLKKALALL